MKICFFSPVRNPDYLQRVEFYKQDIDALKALGHEVSIATRLREITTHADFYFVWWWTWAFLPLVFATIYRAPCVITGVFNYRWPFNGRDYFRRPIWQRWLLRAALQKASANIFLSKHEYFSIICDLPVQNPIYLPLAVDTEVYAFSDKRLEYVVLTVAWLSRENIQRKGIDRVIKSVPRVLSVFPQARFIIAGEKGTGYSELRNMAAALGVADSVEFPGVISKGEKIALMQKCSVYLQPSLFEGFGLGILEAMSCGSAVVSTRTGAVPEVVGEAGVLLDEGVDTIAETTISLLANAELRSSFGKLARDRALREFSISKRQVGLARILADLNKSRANSNRGTIALAL